MKRTLITGTVVILMAVSLSACKSNKKTVDVTPPVTPPAKFEAQFGAAFATAYQGTANSEPKDVATGDVIAVNPTAEPVALPSS
jgi:hypothetical protein